MSDALEPTVLDADDQRVKKIQADQRLERVIKDFMGGLSYAPDRVIERGQDGFDEGVRGFFKGGIALFILSENEDVQTFGQILNQYFPGISRAGAYNYIKIARGMAEHAAFQSITNERGGHCKLLTLMESCSDVELMELDTSGEVMGYTLDEIDKMSVRQLKKALRGAREKAKKDYEKTTDKLLTENVKLLEDNAAMKAALEPNGPALQEAKKVFKQGVKHLEEVGILLRKADITVLAQDFPTRINCLALLHHLRSLVDYLEDSIQAVEDPGGNEE